MQHSKRPRSSHSLDSDPTSTHERTHVNVIVAGFQMSNARLVLRAGLYAAVCCVLLACGKATPPGREGPLTGQQPQPTQPMRPPPPLPSSGGPTVIDNPTGGAGNGVVPIMDAGTFDPTKCVTCDPPGGQYCGKIGDGCGGELECGDCKADGYTCGGHGIESVCGADPASGKCSLLRCEQPTGKYCGKLGDSCGGELDCGGCEGSQTCGGRGIANLCGVPMNSPDCKPFECTAGTAQYCGSIGDGCGGQLDCGFCPAMQVCGARIDRLCGTPCPLCGQCRCARTAARRRSAASQ
jgi:hypothetical protein